MELEFVFSEIYHKNLNRYAPTKQSWKLVKAHCEKFVLEYKETFPRIIQAIERFVLNKPFEEKSIKVYFVGWTGASFSNPLTLNARRDMLLMLTTLTHELLHVVFKERDSSLSLEEEINDLVEEIFKYINIDAKEQIEVMRTLSRNKYTHPQ